MRLGNNILMLTAALSAFSSFSNFAQDEKPTSWDGSVIGFEPNSTGLLGDLGGIRSTLSSYGFNYGLVYTTESASNVAGGYNHDNHVSFVDQTAFIFTQDLERFTGIPDATIEGLITNRNHDDNLTTKRVQDSRANFNDLNQEVWGGGSITRLGYLTFSRSFDDRRLHWRVGQMNYQQTFDQIAPCDFQTLSLCGGKSSYARSWDTWNIHSWGTTLAYDFTPSFTLKTGVLEQNSLSSQRGRAWSFTTHGSKGVLIPLEGQYKTTINGLPGLYNLGVLFNNATQEDLYTARGETTKTHNRTFFLWGGFNQQVTRSADALNRGMSVAGGFGLGDQRTDPFHIAASLAVRYRGLFDAMPNDWIGLGVSWLDMSKYQARAQRLQNEVNGVSDYNDPNYTPVQGHSIQFDLYYRFRPLPWLDIQPDVQYWIRPGAVKETQDAVVVGLKTAIRF
ncbi:TPA: carbohydrate porin [Klebsiella pneumoniae]|nr:carbohydrate porin [Klebsiella pneumoniae]HDQ3433323.1 carbohydrate porin [Klebsiella pneumoniae]